MTLANLANGAYGLGVSGLASDDLLALPVEHDWVGLEVRTVMAGEPPPLTGVGPDHASFPLLDGAWATVDRHAGTATRGASAPADPTALVHPFLAAVAAVHASWAGRAALHAGAILTRGGHAWLVAAPSGGGKSTTLATLALTGASVMTDDLAVVDPGGPAGPEVLAGPRVVDLRPDAAAALEAPLASVRHRSRHRLTLAAVPLRAPVAGVVHLEWVTDAVPALTALDPRGRAGSLTRPDLWAMPADPPDLLLALTALPAYVLRRPKGRDSVPATAALLAGLP